MFKVEESGEVQLGENKLAFTLVDGMLSIAINGVQKCEVRIDEPTTAIPEVEPQVEPKPEINTEHLPTGWYHDDNGILRRENGEPVHSVNFNTPE